MAWGRTDLIDWVLARIDEIAPTEQTAVPGRDSVGRELDEAAFQIIRKVRKQLLYPAATDVLSHGLVRYVNDEPFSLVIPLPEEFARFLRVRAQGWNVPVDDLVSVDSNAYRQQINAFQRATANQPLAALIPFVWTGYTSTDNPDERPSPTKHAIELFPCPDVTLLQEVSQVTVNGSAYGMKVFAAEPTIPGLKPPTIECLVIEKLVAEEIPDELVDPMVWLAAGRCLTSLREGSVAQTAYANYSAAIQDLSIGFKGEDMPEKK